MKIIVDVMGADLGLRPAVEAGALAVRRHGIEVVLVGRQAQIEEVLTQQDISRKGLTILDAPEVVTMEDDPVKAARTKKNSSMMTALQALARGDGDAMVSAGNTGALLTGSTLYVRRIEGVRRGALATVLPTAKGKSLLIDCGANVESTPEYLVQFAYMGSAYMEGVFGVRRPKVGLINNGTEETKGTPLQIEAHQLLKEADRAGKLRFIGNIEGRDIAAGVADVMVCDGFTGNVVLKTYEGVGIFFAGVLKKTVSRNTLTKIAALSMRKSLRALRRNMDYKEVGGAPILGIRKPVIKAHGASDAKAFASAIEQAMHICQSGAAEKIAAACAPPTQEQGG